MAGRFLSVVDDFLPGAIDFRESALDATYGSLSYGSEVYERMSVTGSKEESIVKPHIERVVGFPIEPVASYWRLSGVGESTGMGFDWRVHADDSVAAYSCVLHLSAPGLERGGTAFWRPLDANRVVTLADFMDPSLWSLDLMVNMQFNRGILFDARMVHSAQPIAGWGETPEESRLVWACFFNRSHVS
jgi:hypothetical protein